MRLSFVSRDKRHWEGCRSSVIAILSTFVALTTLGLSGCDFAKNYINSDVEPISHDQLRPLTLLVAAGQQRRAEAELAALCAQHPRSVEARRLLQDLRRQQQPGEQLTATYRDQVTEHPRDSIAHYLLGRVLIDEPLAAREQFEKAAALDPENPWPTVGIAYLARSRGDFFAAVATYRDALLLAPRSARLRWFLGTLYLDLLLLVDAKRELQLAQRLDPDNPEVWSALGRVHMAMGNHRLARSALLRSRAVMPEQVALYPSLVELYLRWRCPAKAAVAYRAGLDYGMGSEPQLEGRLRALQLVAGEDEDSCREPTD